MKSGTFLFIILVYFPLLAAGQRPQTPVQPFGYEERPFKFMNEKDSIHLAGTLTLPEGEGPFPAVILLTVALPNDRDQTHSFHKPYLVLSDHLTRNGYATLRWDDRGVGNSEGNYFQSTIEDLSTDALEAMEFLKSVEKIDPARIGLVGNSEGALVAAKAAAGSDRVAFIGMLGGAGVPAREAITLQYENIMQKSGLDEKTIKKIKNRSDSLFHIVLDSSLTESERKSRLMRLILPGEQNQGGKANLNYLLPGSPEQQVRLFMTPWYRYQISYDPYDDLKKVNCPVLAITGSHDLFMDPDQNLPAIQSALVEAGNDQYTIIKWPGLNHVMQPAETGLLQEYGKIEISFSPDVMDFMVAWLNIFVVN